MTIKWNEVAKGLPKFYWGYCPCLSSCEKDTLQWQESQECERLSGTDGGVLSLPENAYTLPSPLLPAQAGISQTLRVPTCNQRSNEQR